ncbi:unnamed protein product [Moneuplotes crassus]|uniref:Uncharacterized protein n=1 Tax=Euplotes crassus TaxID=5936 RepID=A0AAD1UKU7_EUPCR|nr:unnamed protein product [Moneuplotes crassus]
MKGISEFVLGICSSCALPLRTLFGRCLCFNCFEELIKMVVLINPTIFMRVSSIKFSFYSYIKIFHRFELFSIF